MLQAFFVSISLIYNVISLSSFDSCWHPPWVKAYTSTSDVYRLQNLQHLEYTKLSMCTVFNTYLVCLYIQFVLSIFSSQACPLVVIPNSGNCIIRSNSNHKKRDGHNSQMLNLIQVWGFGESFLHFLGTQ